MKSDKSVKNIIRWCGAGTLCLLLWLVCQTPFRPAYGQISSDPSETSHEPEIAEEHEPVSDVPSELSLFEEIPVVVTASKKTERVTEAPSILTIITAEEIQRMGARTIMDVLRTIPGIEIVQDSWGVSQIAVRGLRSDSSEGVKILLDGHALNDPFTGGATAFYEDLPLHNVRRIEVIRGPASSIYGANAFVSVINIITKDAQDIDSIQISLGGGSFQTINSSFLVGKMLHDLEISLYADYYTTQGAKLFVEADAMSLYDETTPDDFPQISLTPGNFRVEEERLDLAYKLTYHDLTLHGRFRNKQRGPFLTDLFVLNTGSTEEVSHFYTALEYQRFFTQRLELGGKIFADYFEGRRFETVAPGYTVFSPTLSALYDYPKGLMRRSRLREWQVGAETQLNYRLFRNNDLTLGAAYGYLTVQDFHIRTNEANYIRGFPPNDLYDLTELIPDVQTSSYQNVASVFAQDTWKIRRDVDLTFGIRWDYFSEFGGVSTPKLGITYSPTQRVNIKALFGTAFRVPSFSETFMEREAQGSAAREDLVVEELRTFEIGVGYKPSDWLVGEVNYFYTDINELAELADGEQHESYPIETTRTYQNVGGIEVQGVELELRGSSEKQIGLGILPRIIGSSFRLNYSYQYPEDSITHEKVPNMARHKGNIGVGVNLSAERSGPEVPGLFRSFSDEFSLYTHVFLCGKRERSQRDIRDDLPGFAIVDLTLTAHDVFHKGLGVSFTIENLLDTDYRDPTPEFAPDDPFSTIPDDYPNPGRALFLELRYTF